MEYKPTELKEFVPALLSRGTRWGMLLPLTTNILEAGHIDMFKEFIKYLQLEVEPNRWKSSQAPRQILTAYAKTQPSLDSLKQIYQILSDIGCFQCAREGNRDEHLAHRCLFVAAVQAGDDLYAATEYEVICNLDSSLMDDDHELHRLFAEMKARCGDWDSAFHHIARFSVAKLIRPAQIDGLLNYVATAALKSGSAEDIELVLRRLFELYNFRVKRSFVLPVIDRYCSSHDITGLCSWLQFCADAGLKIDDHFLELFYKRCRKFWSFGWRDLENLDETLRVALPELSANWPSWRPRLTNNRMIAHHQLARSTDDGAKCVSVPKPGGRNTVFQQMLDLVDAKKWERAYKLYDTTFRHEAKFSAQCFRLAIESCIQLDGGNTDRAGELIREAFEQGHDFSQALTAFLLQKLAEGERAQTLLDDMLRLGIQIHDEVYNKAARSLTKEGKYVAAKRVCHLAARENGEGNLAYNQYNFANLLYLLVGAKQYEELEELLRKFMSGTQFWHGSKVCKENVKLAMKTVAQRCVKESNQQNQHRKALDMLDAAFVHIKANRATKNERQQLVEQFGTMVVSALKAKESRAEAHGARVDSACA
jgi:tetratricopeptide (TPR) repeat protein